MIAARRLPMLSLVVLLALTASGILFYLADWNLACGWRNNVVRNWEQYGFWTLKGQLVQNPGGYEALTKPEIYPGHRPASLYPVFIVKRLFAWTGAGSLAFCITLSLGVLLSTGYLLGNNRVAWTAGVAAIMCPGFASFLPVLDPNAIVILLGLPYAAIVLSQLSKSSLSPRALAGIFLLIAAYTGLNWSTAFAHGMVLAYLLVAQRIPRRRVWLYLVLAGVNVALIASISVLQKLGTGAAGGGGLKDFLGYYAWGSGGYGTYLTTDRAATRLLFVGLAGLLPLMPLCVFLLIRGSGANAVRTWKAFAPLAVAVLGVGIMRNFFGHHPWIAGSVFVVGLVLSMGLIASGSESIVVEKELGAKGLLLPAAYLIGCFAYGAVVTTMATLHNLDSRTLVALIRAHTSRSDGIAIVETDSKLANIAAGVSESADRRVVVVQSLSTVETIGSRAFLISTSADMKLPLVARTSTSSLASWPLVQKMLELYSTKVGRRLPGNRGLRPGACYLYELNPIGRVSSGAS